MIFNIVKKKAGAFWPRLLKSDKKEPTVKADWDKWIDEDEEEKKPAPGWDPESMEGMHPHGEGKCDSDDDEEEEEGKGKEISLKFFS